MGKKLKKETKVKKYRNEHFLHFAIKKKIPLKIFQFSHIKIKVLELNFLEKHLLGAPQEQAAGSALGKQCLVSALGQPLRRTRRAGLPRPSGSCVQLSQDPILQTLMHVSNFSCHKSSYSPVLSFYRGGATSSPRL